MDTLATTVIAAAAAIIAALISGVHSNRKIEKESELQTLRTENRQSKEQLRREKAKSEIKHER